MVLGSDTKYSSFKKLMVLSIWLWKI